MNPEFLQRTTPLYFSAHSLWYEVSNRPVGSSGDRPCQQTYSSWIHSFRKYCWSWFLGSIQLSGYRRPYPWTSVWPDLFMDSILTLNANFRNYVNESDALSKNLVQVSRDSFIMRADYTTVLSPDGPGRDSVRILSKNTYNATLMMCAQCSLSYRFLPLLTFLRKL